MRTGIQWRDLPERFGRWNSVFKRFNLWSKKGVLQKWFQSISSDNDPEWLFIDGSIVKAHQDSSGAASSSDEAIGKSRGGSSTKIHLAVDSGGLPVYFEISGGQINDIVHAQSLVSAAPKSCSVTADKGYDSDNLRAFIKAMAALPITRLVHGIRSSQNSMMTGSGDRSADRPRDNYRIRRRKLSKTTSVKTSWK